MIFCKWFSI